MIVAVLMILLCTTEAPYILPVVTGFFTISPFNHFFLVVGVLPDHPLVCQLPPPPTCAGCAISHYQTKNSILFAYSSWHSHLEQGVHSLTILHGMHLVVPTHLSLFCVVYHPGRTFLPKNFELGWAPPSSHH